MVSYKNLCLVFARKGNAVCLMIASAVKLPHLLRKTILRLAIVMLGAVVILAGCGAGSTNDGNDDGHRFANDPRTTSVPAATLEATIQADQRTEAPIPTASPKDSLSLRSAPQFAYLVIDGNLHAYDTVGRTFTPLNVPDGMTVLEFASSPTGDRVGVLGMQNDNVIVQFFGADGEPLGEPTILPISYLRAAPSPVGSPEATPQSGQASNQLGVTWVPQGNALVVAGPGVLQRVSMSGAVMPISRAGVTGNVIRAWWSPMDSQVAILTQLPDGHRGVFLLDSGRAEARELNVLHLQPDQGLSDLQWLPNGLGMVLIAGKTSDGDLMNGQIYVYRFNEDVPTLVATSGQGGPAATITNAVVSPDGHSVAYAVMVRDLNQWHLHSLWVKPITGGPGISIPLDSNSPVTNIIWTAEGLVWQQEDGSISVVDADLQPRRLGEAPLATPSASPVSSPIASPVEDATPRG